MTSQASVSLPVRSNGMEQSPSEVSSSPDPCAFQNVPQPGRWPSARHISLQGTCYAPGSLLNISSSNSPLNEVVTTIPLYR